MPAINLLSELISTEELRSMLGVSPKELKDDVVDLPIYLRSVRIAANRLDSRLLPIYTALPGEGLSDDEQSFEDLFVVYVGWLTAQQMSISLVQWSPRQISDGKAILERDTGAAAQAIANIAANLAAAAQDLVAAAQILQPVQDTIVTVAYAIATFGATGDPVTG